MQRLNIEITKLEKKKIEEKKIGGWIMNVMNELQLPMVGERSSTELEIKLTSRLLFPTPESPINKILKERS